MSTSGIEVGSGPRPPQAPAEGEPSPAAAPPYAGFILQRGGRLERIVSWDGPRLCAGRSQDCELRLSQPEVSRRHALFVRDGDCFEVRDLRSVNGTTVNGEPVERRILQVGDVVGIEDYELTFVLEPQALGREVQLAPTPAGAEAEAPDEGFTPLQAELPPSPEVTQRGAPPPPELRSAATLRPGAGELVLELCAPLNSLPAPLRAALESAGDEPLRLPVELRLRVRQG